MTKARLLLTGLLTGALVLGAGCATPRSQPPPAPDTGGSGLDPNPDHNVPGAPTSAGASPINAPVGPQAPIDAPTQDGIPAPGAPPPMP